MPSSIHSPLLALALLASMPGPSQSQDSDVRADRLAAAVAEAERVAGEDAKALVRERARYLPHFREAYARYPLVPAGMLEAIAHVQTGWNHVGSAKAGPAHDGHMPAAHGLMGLYSGQGFRNQVGEAAKALGVGEDLVRRDAKHNIMAAALLLDRSLRAGAKAAQDDEAALAAALMRYAGFPGGSNVGDYARQSFAYDVLTAMRDGVNRDGVSVPARRLVLERAFDDRQLALLQAPVLEVDGVRDTVRPADAQAKAVDFGEAIWNPASSSNYSTAANATSAVIMHTMEGSYAGAISWFRNPSAQVSAHYLLRKSDGQITQMVREHHQAWHAAYHNGYTIGLEHEGYASDPGTWTDAMVNASARLTRSICQRRGVDCRSAWQGPGYDYWHVVPDSVRIKGHGMLTSNQNRYDPGKHFPWARYYGLINNGAPPPVTAPRYWVDTHANAPGFGSPTSTAQTGTLNAGTNYVYCKTWGREIRNGASFNRWWMKTDLDVGPTNQWVSAYYLGRWGNDEARDNDGYDLPRCEVLPYGEIARKYYALGGVRSVLGVPKLAELAAQAGGRFQEFNNGIILWHAQSGAFAIHGQILQRFWATGSETRWGFALMDELNAARSPVSGQVGKFQYFQKGLFLWTPATGAQPVHGAILSHFEQTGREERYGYPKSVEEAHGSNGRKQVFEKATFYWTPEQGVWTQ